MAKNGTAQLIMFANALNTGNLVYTIGGSTPEADCGQYLPTGYKLCQYVSADRVLAELKLDIVILEALLNDARDFVKQWEGGE